MQSENKNGSVRLSTRYQQYDFAKRHLGGFGGRKVFPIGESDGVSTIREQERTQTTEKDMQNIESRGRCSSDIQQLNKPTHSNNRVYSEKGISPTLNTAQGGNRQPKIVKVCGDVDKRKTYLGDIASTLAANPTSDNVARLFEDNKIRRLTPKECERLMGLPDNWLRTGIDENGSEVKISDTQSYKLAGNGIVIPVVEEIIKRLFLCDTQKNL